MLHVLPELSMRGHGEGSLKSIRIAFWTCLVVTGGLVAGYSVSQRIAADRGFAVEVHRAQDEARRIQSDVVLFTKSFVPARQNFASLLQNLGISRETTAR